MDELLARWRETRDPEIADRIAAEPRGVPVTGRSYAARAKACAELAAGGERIADVLATDWPPKLAEAWPIVDALLALPDDPRVAMAVAQLVGSRRYKLQPYMESRVFARLAELRDARTLRYLADVGDGEPATAARRILAELPPYVPPPDVRPADEEALLAQIHANPDDLAARAVYGDYLSARGDPRGELIALQLGTASQARIAKLLARHGARWAEPIGKYFEDHVFEYGFFAGGALEAVPSELDDPAWKLVRVLAGSHSMQVAGRLPNLRARIEHIGAPIPGPWSAVTLSGTAIDDRIDGTLAGTPALRTLGLVIFGQTDSDWFERSGLLARIERLAIRGPQGVAIAARLARRAGALRVLEIVETTTGRLHKPLGWQLVLSRDEAPGPWTHLHARIVQRSDRDTLVPFFADLVGGLPPTLRELVVEAKLPALARPEVERLVAAVAHHPAVRATVPWSAPPPRAPVSEPTVRFAVVLDYGKGPHDVVQALFHAGQRLDYVVLATGAIRPLEAFVYLNSLPRPAVLRSEVGPTEVHFEYNGRVHGVVIARRGQSPADVCRQLASWLKSPVTLEPADFGALRVGFLPAPLYGRLIAFGRGAARYLPAALDGATIDNGVIIVEGAPSQAAADALATSLRVAMQRAYLAERGYDLQTRASAVLADRGFVPAFDPTWPFEARFGEGDDALTVTLLPDPPQVVIAHRGHKSHGPANDLAELDAVLTAFTTSRSR